MLQHALDLAVLALAQAHRQPDVASPAGARAAPRCRRSRCPSTVTPSRKRVELLLRDLAMRAHAIAAQPAGRGQFEHAREAAVVGQQQQPLGVDVEPADRDDARQILGQRVEDGRAALGVARGRDEPARLVEEEQTRALGRRAAARRRRARRPRALTLKAGLVSTSPLTLTRPAAIQASASRREHSPARAITLAMRSPARVSDLSSRCRHRSACFPFGARPSSFVARLSREAVRELDWRKIR